MEDLKSAQATCRRKLTQGRNRGIDLLKAGGALTLAKDALENLRCTTLELDTVFSKMAAMESLDEKEEERHTSYMQDAHETMELLQGFIKANNPCVDVAAPPQPQFATFNTFTDSNAASASDTKDEPKLQAAPVQAMFNPISAFEQLSIAATLPPIKPQQFDGKPDEFPAFKLRFDLLIARRPLDEPIKFAYLMTLLKGEALEAVRRYEVIPGGLSKAMYILERRYGGPYRIAQVTINKLVSASVISPNDTKGLQTFADEVQVTYDMLFSMKCLNEVSSYHLERIIRRLPKHLQNKFAVKLYELENREGRHMPLFSDVVEFIQYSAAVATHPFFSYITDSPDKSTMPKRTVMTTLASGVQQNSGVQQKPCNMCSNPHPLYKCERFVAKSERERVDFAKSWHMCFNCLCSDRHVANNCMARGRCKLCNLKHHTLLHLPQSPFARKEKETIRKEEHAPREMELGNGVSCSTATSSEGLIQVVPILILGKKTVSTYALLDSGSNVTIIDESLAMDLKLPGKKGKLTFSTIQSKVEQDGMVVSVGLQGIGSQAGEIINVDDVMTIKNLSIPMNSRRKVFSAPHLRDIPHETVDIAKISVIIGTNVQEAFVPIEVRTGLKHEPVAIRTCLGWSVLGRHNNNESNTSCHVFVDSTLSSQLERFWTIEECGTILPGQKAYSVEDSQAAMVFTNTIKKHEDGHYEVGLPWKEDPVFPDNRVLAELRLRSLERRFSKQPQLREGYRSIITGYVEEGYARKLSTEEASQRNNKTWYLPHHAVVHPKKGKVRMVFDAAACYKGSSLNKALLPGPDLINGLIGVLLRFRRFPIAVTADIRAMFHQIRVSPEDTDALRFLWSDGEGEPPDVYQMNVHIFGATSSPFIANACLKQCAYDTDNTEVSEVIKTNFYVDDCLVSTMTVAQAITLVDQLVPTLLKNGFHLTKFLSNNKGVLCNISVEERSQPLLNLELQPLPTERTLGLYWEAERDFLVFTSKLEVKPATKRGILSAVSSLYDPLGFIAPFVLLMKTLLQDLWRLKLPWDDPIPDEHSSKWEEWKRSLLKIGEVQIPRCVFNCEPQDVQFHYFSDASMVGYGAVCYVRYLDGSGNVFLRFVMGKSKCAPLKELTIPRLELQASVLATRLSHTVQSEFVVRNCKDFFWTDSTTTLHCLNNQAKRFPVFVANRVGEILRTTNASQWNFVPGTANPADIGSRGARTENISQWILGPEFLTLSKSDWPIQPEILTEKDIKKETVMCTTTNQQQVFDLFLARFSSWKSLLKSTVWLQRFITYICYKRTPPSRIISNEEMQRAISSIVKYAQSKHFHEEKKRLLAGQIVTSQSKLATLSPIISEGIIRVGGRIRHAPVVYEAAHPMILPAKDHISEIITRSLHESNGHSGREYLHNTIRRRFWILHGRSLVRKVIHNCIPCRKRLAPSITQMMSDLPKERLTAYEPPFTYTGCDFFGPFHVQRGRSTEKIYGCIFVCFNSRAIHIEDVASLEASSFILAFRRFVSNRGTPKELWCDNATNFVGAKSEMEKASKSWRDHVTSALVDHEVTAHMKWKFSPPTASHMNGVWERLIRSVRNVMRAVLGNNNSRMKLETLRTVFAEAVVILNNRPLYARSDDPKDLEPITPNHLLLHKHDLVSPIGIFSDSDIYCRKQWRHSQFLADCFWKRWLKDYVPTLQQRRKWLKPNKHVMINDLVLIVDFNAPRSTWRMGRVVDLFQGTDGLVRVAKLRTQQGVLIRPLAKLCLLSSL